MEETVKPLMGKSQQTLEWHPFEELYRLLKQAHTQHKTNYPACIRTLRKLAAKANESADIRSQLQQLYEEKDRAEAEERARNN